MDDEREKGPAAQEGVRDEGTVPSREQKRPRRRWAVKILSVVVAVPILVMGAWLAITMNWVYSKGERAGFIQKFSEKGWVCKTWEGEIAMVNMPGAAQERFSFTVRDDSLAREITRLMGSRVTLDYEQHRGVPSSCFGETQYYVTGVKAVP